VEHSLERAGIYSWFELNAPALDFGYPYQKNQNF
jgi:hypothetical protein